MLYGAGLDTSIYWKNEYMGSSGAYARTKERSSIPHVCVGDPGRGYDKIGLSTYVKLDGNSRD